MKRPLLIATFIALAASISQADLVAGWNFDSTYTDAGHTWVPDVSGVGTAAPAQLNAATTGYDPFRGSTVLMPNADNGVLGAGAMIPEAATPGGKFNNFKDSFTIAFWFSIGFDGGVAEQGKHLVGPENYGPRVYSNGSSVLGDVQLDNPVSLSNPNAPRPGHWQQDSWHHVVFGFDGNGTYVYLDGAFSSFLDTPSTEMFIYNSTWWLQFAPVDSDDRTLCKLDDVAYYNGSLLLPDEVGLAYIGVLSNFELTTTPEPATLALLGLGAFVLRRKK